MTKYSVVRFFNKIDKPPQIIKTGLTLKEAKEHCNRPDTQKPGVWFDGFNKE